MKKKLFFYTIFVLVLFSNCSTKTEKNDFIEDNFSFANKQMRQMLIVLGDSSVKLPKTISDENDELKCVTIHDWTSGFFPGTLWYLYEYTKDDFWRTSALKYTHLLEPIQNYTDHHDIGFMMYSSYGNAYRLTGNRDYESILLNSAKSLSTRYFSVPKTIRSWDHKKSWNGNEWHCPVIIDNLMNLELLFFASKLTNDSSFYKIAVNHADNTMKNHVRDDYSCYHVVDYDTISGKVIDRATFQGYSDNSAWARGQSWAVYGFTVMYRETKDSKYLDVARKMADFYLNHPNLPEDKVPYWDLNIEEDGFIPAWTYTDERKAKVKLKDTSAAAVMASALMELSSYVGKEGIVYYNSGEQMIKSLSDKYRNAIDSGNYFILDHSVGNFPRNYEIDVPLNYTDYYYLEALLRYEKVKVKMHI